MRVAFGALLALVVFAAQPATAQLLPPEHDGFFLRLQTGPGAVSASRGPASLQAMSGSLGVALGGSVAKNLILYGELLHQRAFDPKVEIDGTRFASNDPALTLTSFGPGLAYYIMPANLYLSASALLSQVELREGRGRSTNDLGYGGRFSLGKEWWVSRDWGLGLALVADLAHAPTEGSSAINARALSLAFSATLN